MRKITRNSIVYTGRRMMKDPEVKAVRIIVEYQDGSETSYCSLAETLQRDLNDLKNAIISVSTPLQKGIEPSVKKQIAKMKKPVKKASKKKSSPKKKSSSKKKK